MPPPEDNTSSNEVNKVAVKFPPFWDRDADLWFINIEAQFVLSNITQDTTKYYAVVSSLNSEALSHVSDIVRNPPANDRYKVLKDRLIAEFSDSEQKRVKDLLVHTVLGDDRPSHLLRKMRQLADNKVGEEFLKTLWIQRLPKETQAIVSVSDGNLDKLAQMADKIVEIAHPQIAEMQRTKAFDHGDRADELANLQAQVAALTEQVSRLSRPSYRRENRYRSKSGHGRNRSQTPKRRNSDFCWYHDTFGGKARQCRPPCDFQKSENS